MTLQRDELLVAVTGLSLTLKEIDFAAMVVVAESEEENSSVSAWQLVQ